MVDNKFDYTDAQFARAADNIASVYGAVVVDYEIVNNEFVVYAREYGEDSFCSTVHLDDVKNWLY